MSGIEKVQIYSQSVYTTTSDRISEAIIHELKKYGISISDASTEARAKELIDEKKTESNKKVDNPSKNSEKQVIQDVKILASTLGVSVSDSDSIKIVLDNLKGKINAQLEMCEALNDKSGLSEIKDIQSRFIIVDEKAKDIFSNQSMLNLSIDSLATTNIVAKNLV